jgi:very-short-patch-repair endonuclease
MTKVYNRSSEKNRRKTLRSNLPQAEVILWSRLKNKALDGYKFRRQYSIGKFVINFYCPRLKLAIEVDGDSHFSEKSEPYDKERQRFIESFKISFLRFTNKDIYENLDEVLGAIKLHTQKKSEESSGVVNG